MKLRRKATSETFRLGEGCGCGVWQRAGSWREWGHTGCGQSRGDRGGGCVMQYAVRGVWGECGRGMEGGCGGDTLAVVRAGGIGGVVVACREQLAADGGDAGIGVRQSLTPGAVLSNKIGR